MKICYQCRLFFRELFIFILTAYAVFSAFHIPWPAVFAVAALPVFVSFGTLSCALGGLRALIPTAALSFFSANPFAVYLPLLTWALPTLAVRSGRRWAQAVSAIFTAAWICLSFLGEISWADTLFIISSALTLFFALPLLKGKTERLTNIDIIVKSVTGNTMRAAEKFADGALSVSEGKINIIKWEENKPEMEAVTGDGLAIAFPVHLFGTGRKFLADMIKKLPAGNGKPAFILYTASLYPGAAAFVLWAALSFKGYRVKGTLWEATGPLKIKSLSEKTAEHENGIIFEAGGDFADGWPCGEPLIIPPSPLFILGLLKK